MSHGVLSVIVLNSMTNGLFLSNTVNFGYSDGNVNDSNTYKNWCDCGVNFKLVCEE